MNKEVKEARGIIKKIPKRYSKYLSGRIIKTNKDRAASIYTKTGDLFLDRKWNTTSKSQKIDLIYHELSHRILYLKRSKMSQKILSLYKEGFIEEPRFDLDPFEDMVDTVAAFIQPRYHSALKRNAPRKYEAIRLLLR